MAVTETVVLDASAALDWFNPAGTGSYSSELRAAIRSGAIEPVTPFHFDLECASVLTRWYRSKHITRAALESAVNQLTVMQTRVLAIPATPAELTTLALKYHLSPYDAMYFHIAVSEGASLATLDGGLIEACRSHKVRHWQAAVKPRGQPRRA